MSARPRCIAFRLELGGATGWGHLARCSALAAELRARGWTCVAWTDGDLAAAPDDLREPFVATRAVSAGPGAPEWIVVDHYHISDADLRELRRNAPAARVLAIDDEAKRALDAADVVVNARLGLEFAPYACRQALLGERYALLRTGLRAPAKIAAEVGPDHVPILVMLGGTDPRSLTALVIEALAEVDARRIVPVVVRSRSPSDGGTMGRALQPFRTSRWLERIDAATLAGWAGVCRCAVSACGGAVNELAYLGLPFVGVVVAENQRPLAREVDARWHLPIVDADQGEFRAKIAAATRRLISSPAMSRASFGGIDGLGAARVADVIGELSR